MIMQELNQIPKELIKCILIVLSKGIDCYKGVGAMMRKQIKWQKLNFNAI